MKKNVSFALFFFLNLILYLNLTSCSTTDPKLEPDLKLELKDVSCTEAWLQLTTNNIQLPAKINLFKNNSVSQTFSLSTQDSLLYVDSLLPNQNYSFQVSSIQNPVSSNKVAATTLDTTTHNFTWQTFTFGQHSSSVLYDVAIIDENNIWAVGEIYMNDSLGYPDPQAYGAAHWNGISWKLIKVSYHDFNQTAKYPGPLFSLAILDGEIYVVSYANLLKWNGTDWQEVAFFMEQIPFNGQVLKMWGTGQNNIYCVGRSGSIYHYFGTSWRKLESGTDVDIQDIWGINDGINDPFILCAASYVAQLGEHKILRINNTYVDSIKWDTGRRVHSVWFNSRQKLYTCGGGVFFGAAPGYNWKEQTDVPLFYTERVRGENKNDLFAVGDFGLLAHYNGTTWKTYPEAATAEAYSSLDYKNNLMVVVGLTQTQAVVQFMFHN